MSEKEVPRPSDHDVHFPWEVLRSIVDGRSAIDIPRLALRDEREAREFLQGYGFDVSLEAHRDEIERIRLEAIEFIDDELLEGLSLEIPRAIVAQTQIESLLLEASAVAGENQRWACALLRVMHTLAHSHSYFNQRYGDEIRQQIFARFEPHLAMTDTGLLLGRNPGIELVSFEVKPTKSRRSVALKLLHKVDNVAADVFDRIGARFVTHQRLDAALVVRYLREHNVIMFANIKPSRSRNTLIDIEWLTHEIERLDGLVARGQMSEAEQREVLRREVERREYPEPPAPSPNPYSSLTYHSIQFTCRQMIRIPGGRGSEDVRFFFPFEIQNRDEAGYGASREGRASHDLYKARQKESVRRRVLGPLYEG